MADCWRRSEYDRGRRGSYPNKSWHREPAQPRRPPPPPSFPRRQTFDSRQPQENNNSWSRPEESGHDRILTDNMNDQGKRALSRSPKGEDRDPRKRARQNQSVSVPADNSNTSRRSSMSDSTSHQDSNGGQTPTSLHNKQIGQLNSMTRKDSEVATNNAPYGNKDRHEDASSGRSTPQVNGDRTAVAAPTVQDIPGRVSTSGDLAPSSAHVLNMLMDFNTNVAAHASLHVSRDHAGVRLNRVQKSVENEKDLSRFGQIKDQLEKERRDAQVAFDFEENKLQVHMTAQQELMKPLACIIGQAMDVKVPTDCVSRDDFKQLQADHESLTKEVDTSHDTITKMRSDLIDTSRIAKNTDALSSPISALQNDTKTLLGWKANADKSLNGVQKEQNELSRKVQTVEEKNMNLFKDVSQLKADKAAAALNISQQSATKGSYVDEEWKAQVDNLLTVAGPKLSSQVKELEETVDQLSTYARGYDVEDLDSPLDDCSSINKQLHRGRQQQTYMSDVINQLLEEVREEGKQPVIQRLKNLDRVVNNLSTKLEKEEGKPLQQRVDQLKMEQESIQKSLTTLQNKAQSQGVIESSVDFNRIEKRLNRMQGDLDNFDAQQIEKDGLVEAHIESSLQPLQDQIANLEKTRKEDVDGFNGSLDFLQKSLEECKEALKLKASGEDVKPLISTIQSLTDDVKKLQSQQQKSSAASTPVPAGLPQAPSGSNAAMTSPQLPNGVGGSPRQPNGVPPPRNSSPLPNNPVSGPIVMQEINKLRERVDAVIGAQQHLKQRCDNIQTDDLAVKMVDQMSNMYPYAKDVDMKIRDLAQSGQALGGHIEQLRKEKLHAVNTLDNNINRVRGGVREASSDAKDAKEKATKVASDLEQLAKKVDHMVGTAGTGNAVSIRSDSTAWATKDDVEAIRKTAKDADILSKQHSSRFSKLNPEKTKEKLDDLEKTVQEKLRELEKNSEEVKKHVDAQGKSYGIDKAKLTNLQTEVSALSDLVAKASATIEGLEKHLQ